MEMYLNFVREIKEQRELIPLPMPGAAPGGAAAMPVIFLIPTISPREYSCFIQQPGFRI